MNTIQKRFLLFLIGCIGTRTLFVYLAKNASKTYLQYMGYLSILPAIGFFYLFLSGSRKTGPEVFDDKIWWNDLRPIHGLIYFLFAYNAIKGNNFAWLYLLVDVIIGLISFLIFHYNNNDFTPFRISNAQWQQLPSLIYAHKVGVLIEKRCKDL
jgi:hypothetical protein